MLMNFCSERSIIDTYTYRDFYKKNKLNNILSFKVLMTDNNNIFKCHASQFILSF